MKRENINVKYEYDIFKIFTVVTFSSKTFGFY